MATFDRETTLRSSPFLFWGRPYEVPPNPEVRYGVRIRPAWIITLSTVHDNGDRSLIWNPAVVAGLTYGEDGGRKKAQLACLKNTP